MDNKSMINKDFLQEITKSFPADFLSCDDHDLKIYGKDWTEVYPPNPCAIAFPRSTQEVADLLKLCSTYKISIVPSGGRTGLAGGAVATNGELVLSFNRMNRIDSIDLLSQTVRVQAGAITQTVHETCAHLGLTWPVDFASKGSSHVGGNISTNAGGVNVIRYGMTRRWVLGLQVVTMKGEVLELNGTLEKNNTGADLKQLFIGTEGTLGVITEATLKLVKLHNERTHIKDVLFFSLSGYEQALNLLKYAHTGPFVINAFECMSTSCLSATSNHFNIPSPLKSKAEIYILLEIERERSDTSSQIFYEWVQTLYEQKLVIEGTLAQSTKEAKTIWTLREGIAESLRTQGLMHSNDISIPISSLDRFLSEMKPTLNQHYGDIPVHVFGHIGDGNLHIHVVMPKESNREKFLNLCKVADLTLFALVKKYLGSISAEHGIGLLKKPYLKFSRTDEEIAYLRELKNIFDPDGLLNPGKIF